MPQHGVARSELTLQAAVRHAAPAGPVRRVKAPPNRSVIERTARVGDLEVRSAVPGPRDRHVVKLPDLFAGQRGGSGVVLESELPENLHRPLVRQERLRDDRGPRVPLDEPTAAARPGAAGCSTSTLR